MGEVYRADDLKLGQAVALKFLPPALAKDPAALERFHREVRVAREVTHPNVCRVHDIGEVGGQHFLSMEYVDGEDLASLLRRIGRLPEDKGLQLARQLCAGLAAAHDKGVLHRDLKPANVMIDGRGRVRITDFGLAGLAEEIRGEEVLAGTPAYMAPEQLAGKEVTVKSDIYSLGLVLYELFTGRPAFQATSAKELLRMQETTGPRPPSAIVPSFNPALEKVLLRCLERDSRARPSSALEVAALLPGGDPLAAALAAGVTPAPEMVAAAGEVGLLQPAVGWACLVAVLLGLGLFFVIPDLQKKTTLFGQVPLEKPPEVLKEKARDVLQKLGYKGAPTDSAFGFSYDRNYWRYVARQDPSPKRWDGLSTGQPAAVYFWYRQSPAHLEPSNIAGRVTLADPAPLSPGMASVLLDTRGRLIEFHAVPPRDEDPPVPPRDPDWSLLFAEAGFDPSLFTPSEPSRTPPVYADSRAAWAGVYPERPEISIRVEAAAYRGKPVNFELVGPWKRSAHVEPLAGSLRARFGDRLARIVFVVVLMGGVLFARRNLRLGRGDRTGAFAVALYVFVLMMLGWVLEASHVPVFTSELNLFVRALGQALYFAGILWLFYIALEPYVRRLWPETIIGWSRLLTGRFRDPLVGRDFLVGAVFGVAWLWLGSTYILAPAWFGEPPRLSSHISLESLLGTRHVVSQFFDAQLFALFNSLLVLFFLILLRVVLRNRWLAAISFFLIETTATFGWFAVWFGSDHPIDWLFTGILVSSFLLLLTRFGLLATLVAFLFPSLALSYPLVTDLSAWYAATSILPILVGAALAVYGFVQSRAGRPLFRDALLQT